MPRKKTRPPSKQCILVFKEGPRAGKQCGSYAVVGCEYCRKHAHYEKGKGITAPNFKHGRYSSTLPRRLLMHYETARADENLLTLREEIAVLDARSKELQQKLNTVESGAAWVELKQQFSLFNAALNTGDQVAVSAALTEIGRLINQGVGEYAQWKEQMQVFKLRKELAKEERDRLLQLKQFMTMERVLNLSTALIAVVREEVDDPAILGAIADKFSRLLNRSGGHDAAQKERADRLEAHEQVVIEHNPLFS